MTSKIKINLQYRNLPIEFNPVSIKARFYLNQINLLLKEKEKEQKDKINAQKSKEEKNILDDSFKENININIKKIPKMRKTNRPDFYSERPILLIQFCFFAEDADRAVVYSSSIMTAFVITLLLFASVITHLT